MNEIIKFMGKIKCKVNKKRKKGYFLPPFGEQFPLPFPEGAQFPLPFPDGLPVVLGIFGAQFFVFAIFYSFWLILLALKL